MRFLEGEEKEEAMKFILEAAEEAKKSTCKKSHRGVVIVKNGEIIGRGRNNTTIEKYCNPCIRENIRDKGNVELCAAYHAEQDAIIDALEKGRKLNGSRMYHVKVKNGEIKTSGEPSCTVCSRLVVRSKIGEFVLLHDKGVAVYDSKEFNEKSFEYFFK